MLKPIRMVALVVSLVILMASCSLAQSYKIDWYSVNSGGGEISGGGYRINASVGQSAAGYVQGVGMNHWIGFWVDESTSPVNVARIEEAKRLPDSTLISMSGKIATSGQEHFYGFFYLEESDRSSGIRVSVSTLPGGLVEGSVVSLTGSLSTQSGERVIVAPSVTITSAVSPLTALGMTNISLGGADLPGQATVTGQSGVIDGSGLNNIGLLVKTWGRVTQKGEGYLYLDDGSGLDDGTYTGMTRNIGVRVVCDPAAHQVDDFITVTGISSCFDTGSGLARRLLVRMHTDITSQD